MSRRSSTFAVAGALLVALVAVAALLPVPYVVYSPGPLADTLGEWEGEPVIVVDGAETFPTEGILDLTTVGVTPAFDPLHRDPRWASLLRQVALEP